MGGYVGTCSVNGAEYTQNFTSDQVIGINNGDLNIGIGMCGLTASAPIAYINCKEYATPEPNGGGFETANDQTQYVATFFTGTDNKLYTQINDIYSNGGGQSSVNSSGNLFSYTFRAEASHSYGGLTVSEYAQIKKGNGIINFKNTDNKSIEPRLEIGNSNLGATISFGVTGLTGFSFSAGGLSIGASVKGISFGISKEIGSSGEMGFELNISPTKAALSLAPAVFYGLQQGLKVAPL